MNKKAKVTDEVSDYFRKIGSKGGKNKKNLSPERRKEIARNAIKARWDKHRKAKGKKGGKK